MDYTSFKERIGAIVPKDRLLTDELMRFAWGTDASFYRLMPELIIRSDSEQEISEILRIASEQNIPVTFRAAGTSLSGQSVSNSVLIVAGKHWEKYSVAPDASTITLQPGIVGAKVNQILAPLGRQFGPDPASIGSCMVGGIVANNASGMSCGTHANSDRTLVSMKMILPDGTILDTGSGQSRSAFRASHPEFISQIEQLRDSVRANQALAARIRKKYSIKNVTGLNLLPLITYDDPFDIIAHSIVGSEGTLAFICEVTMKTLPVSKIKASAMIYFNSIVDAAKAVVAMRGCKITAAEMLDCRSLMSVHDSTGNTAVLTQTEAETQEQLDAQIAQIKDAIKEFDTVTGVNFTTDAETCARYWAIRSGIFPAVGGLRKPGTTCLIEDIAFPIEDLPQATDDLSKLLDKHGYDDSCIYGHALEGNFHFIINQAFESDADVRRYEAMIRDVATMVIDKYDGSLKAEHGTGRNMAPFVEYEWGTDAFEAMKKLKSIFDPKGILNPGVIFNDDPECFIKDFKALPILDTEFSQINKCIECGFCEVNCVTCGFTLSSRTRIAVQREMTMLERTGKDPELLAALRKLYRYAGEQTCAGDGLCSRSCPMGISVADLTHEIREKNMSPTGHAIGEYAGKHMAGIEKSLRGVLSVAELGRAVLGNKAMAGICKGMHKCLGIPLWTPAFPKATKVKLEPETEKDLKVVYFPSCINQTMGIQKSAGNRKALMGEMTDLLHKAGYEVIFPAGMEKLCCGTIWESKGMPDIAEKKVRELEAALWEASEHGKYPVLCDQSPCLHRMRTCISKMKLYEPAEFIHTFLKDRLIFTQTDRPVAVHITCSTRIMGVDKMLLELAHLCSSNVLLPEGVGCCGFAGDKGMTNPEVNAYALRKLRQQVEASGAKEGYSNSRTCEIGLETNSGIPYMSIAYLVNECTESR